MNLPLDRVPQCGETSRRCCGARTGLGSRGGARAHRLQEASSGCWPTGSSRPPRSSARGKDFNYIEEPDIFHEIFGHTPLLADPRFAGFSHAIGQAGLKAAKEDYSWLIRLYWFSIEFGLTVEDGVVKSLGSGLASSPTELPWSVSANGPERRPFDVIDILRTPYRIDIHQPVYFVIENLDDLFAAANRDLMADIAHARSLGLHAPKFPPKEELQPAAVAS